ncbi:MAG: hypothetical protein HYR74_10180 [Candidatus Eisenbacteria bacterium]|nr:hypothetical protein [Candidatus Eisenbacteria bacterium]
MGGGLWKWLLIVAVIVVLVLWLVCTRHDILPGHQPTGVVFGAPFPGTTTGTVEHQRLPSHRHATFSVPKPPSAVVPGAPEEKVHPLLVQWRSQRPTDHDRFIVLWDDPLRPALLPSLDLSQPMNSPANDSALVRARRAIDQVRHDRAVRFNSDTLTFKFNYNAQVIESYWIAQAMLVDMRVDSAFILAANPHVLYVQPDITDEGPPQCTTDGADQGPFVADARRRIVSDPYRAAGYPASYVSLLDTGVNGVTWKHVLLSGSGIASNADCVNGGDNCDGDDPSDQDTEGHGTSTAAILTGDNAGTTWGDAWRGVAMVPIHAYRVYKNAAHHSTSAALRAFQQGVSSLDRVEVVEMQGKTPDTGPLARAADNAFGHGAVVVAANGNFDVGHLAAPANAHMAIGVGGYVLDPTGGSEPTIDSQSYGTTYDGRAKPDLQAPSNTWTASNESSTSCQEFSQTSGATPYVGAAAELLRGWLKNAIGSPYDVDPGQVNAMLLVSTVPPTRPSERAQQGAGRLVLPSDGWGWFTKVTINTTNDTQDVPIDLTGLEATSLDAVVWWPEELVTQGGHRVDTHNDIDLHLFDPSGHEAASSVETDGVRERVTVPITSAQRAKWTLTVTGYAVNHGPQDVYVAISVCRTCAGSNPLTPNP